MPKSISVELPTSGVTPTGLKTVLVPLYAYRLATGSMACQAAHNRSTCAWWR